MNYYLSLVPWFICVTVLAVILMLREHQNSAIQKNLIDRLLVAHGHEPLPDIEPLADLTGEAKMADVTEKIEEAIAKIRRSKTQGTPVKFNIPGMPRAGMGEVKRNG
jgi:hypothetical protein